MRAAASTALATLALCAAAVAAEPRAEEVAEAEGFLDANAQDADGAWAYVHFTPDDAPIVVAVGMPKEPPRLASSAEGREAALEGVRAWVRALRPYVPWFAVQFVESDPHADVEIVWKRRMTAGAAGRGRMEYRIEDGRVVARGSLELATRPNPRGPALTQEEIERVVAHEFGHALGLGHCLACDSAMNDSWQTRERVFVTAVDVKTYLLLLAQPNGVRQGGGPLAGLARTGWALGAE